MKELYRRIPKVDVLLEMPQVQSLIGEFGKKAVTECIRKETDRVRGLVKDGNTELFEQELEKLPDRICDSLRGQEMTGFRRVINATGTILHTNLGRAPIAKEHAEKIAELVSGYSNLEYNLEEGHRGERYSHFERLICQVTDRKSVV